MKVLIVRIGWPRTCVGLETGQSRGWASCTRRRANPGIAALGNCHPVRPTDAKAARTGARAGPSTWSCRPEVPLVAGVADQLRHAVPPCFGPAAGDARGLGIVRQGTDARAGVPTAKDLWSPPGPAWSGRRAGGRKGRLLVPRAESAEQGLKEVEGFPASPSSRSWLVGEELSMRGAGRRRGDPRAGAAQDFKPPRRRSGPNPAAWAPTPPCRACQGEVEAILEQVHRRLLAE